MVKVEIDAMELPLPKQDYRDEIRALIKTDRTILDKVISFYKDKPIIILFHAF